MANVLPPHVARVVLKEWLDSKNGMLDEIVRSIVRELAPIAAVKASEALHGVFHDSPYPAFVHAVHCELNQIDRALLEINSSLQCPTYGEHVEREVACIEANLVRVRELFREWQGCVGSGALPSQSVPDKTTDSLPGSQTLTSNRDREIPF